MCHILLANTIALSMVGQPKQDPPSHTCHVETCHLPLWLHCTHTSISSGAPLKDSLKVYHILLANTIAPWWDRRPTFTHMPSPDVTLTSVAALHTHKWLQWVHPAPMSLLVLDRQASLVLLHPVHSRTLSTYATCYLPTP